MLELYAVSESDGVGESVRAHNPLEGGMAEMKTLWFSVCFASFTIISATSTAFTTHKESKGVWGWGNFFPSPFFASSPSSFSADAAALALRYLRNLRASLWHYLKLSFFVLFSLTRFSHHLVDLMLSCESKKKIFFTEKKNESSEWERDDTAERKKDINYIFSHLLSPESLSLFPPLDDLSLRSQVNDDTRYEKILKVIARSATISWHCTADAHRLFLLPSFFISFHSDVKCCDVGSNGRCASVRESASIISSSRRSLKATN